MQLPLRVAMQAGPSLQAQIFEQLRQLISDGRLKPDMRLPPSRVLAANLGVSAAVGKPSASRQRQR